MAQQLGFLAPSREIGSDRWRTTLWLRSLAVSHDESLVAAGGPDLRVFDAEGGLRWRAEGLTGPVRRLLFSRQDTTIAVVHGERLDVWSAAGARVFERAGSVHALATDGDHGFLAVFGDGESLCVQRVPSGEVVAEIPRSATLVALSREGVVAVVPRGQGGLVELWRGGAMIPLQGPTSFHYEQDAINMWDEPYVETRTEDAWIRALSFDIEGTRLATGGAESVVRLWDATTGVQLGEVDIGERSVGNLVWGGGDIAATFAPVVGGAGPARLWRLPNAVTTLGAAGVVAWHRSRWLRGGADNRINAPGDHRDTHLEGVAVSPDGAMVVVKTHNAVEGLVFETGVSSWRDPMPRLSYAPIVFAGAGGWLPDVSPGDPNPFGVRRFNTGSGVTSTRHAPTPTLTWSLDVSADGRFLAVCGYSDGVALHDIVTGAVVATLVGADAHTVVFSPAGAWVAAADGALREYRWEGDPVGDVAPARQLVPTGTGSSNVPNDDARHLAVRGDRAVSSWNDVVRVWDLTAGVEIAASAAVDRFAGVVVVGFDEDEPYGVVLARIKGDHGASDETVATRWSPTTGVVLIARSPDFLWRYAARGASIATGGFILSGDDGVLRVYPPVVGPPGI